MSAGTTRTLAVVSSGLRQPSTSRLLADRLSAAVVRALRTQGVEPVVEVVELREHAHDLTNMLMTGFATESLQAALDTVTGADGVIAVTPIFSGSYTGLFKTFFDVMDDGALAGTPVLAAATAGTARHSLAIDHAVRPLLSYLRAVVVPTGVFAATDDFGSRDGTRTTASRDGEVALGSRIERGAAELAELVARREARRARDPFTVTTPFEDLLRGGA